MYLNVKEWERLVVFSVTALVLQPRLYTIMLGPLALDHFKLRETFPVSVGQVLLSAQRGSGKVNRELIGPQCSSGGGWESNSDRTSNSHYVN